jgi:hypothetical protein
LDNNNNLLPLALCCLESVAVAVASSQGLLLGAGVEGRLQCHSIEKWQHLQTDKDERAKETRWKRNVADFLMCRKI